MNYTNLNLDLQGVVKKVYDDLLYRSSFMNFLNPSYIGEIRTTGTPMIEVIKTKPVALANANGATPIAPTLATYDSVKIDLTEVDKHYSVAVDPRMNNIAQAIESQINQEDALVANAIDTYGFGKLASATQSFTLTTDPIADINALKATLFNHNAYDDYKLGLEATEYGKLVASLTSILKYETLAGVEGVDRGVVANAYGVDIFPINSSVLGTGVKGYFANVEAVAGDAYFSNFNQFPEYPGLPGMFVIEGRIMFGADIVRDEAIIKLA
jgi:hypothetical protein